MLISTNSSISSCVSFNSNVTKKTEGTPHKTYWPHAFKCELTITHSQVGMWVIVLCVLKQSFKADSCNVQVQKDNAQRHVG